MNILQSTAMASRVVGVLVFALILSITLIGCDSSDSSDSSSTDVIPLAEGNEWTMSVEGDFVPDGQTITLRINGETTIGGDTYRQIDYSTSDGFSSEGLLVTRTTDRGLYIANPRVTENGTQLYGFELRTSVSDGDAYVHTDERNNSYDISITEQSMTVPAGTYDVLVYRIAPESGGMTDVAFIAPGVGPVQLDFRGEIYRLESTNVQ